MSSDLKVLETCLYAEDISAMRDFYGDVLELECFLYTPPRQAFFRLEDSVLLIFNPEITSKDSKLPPHGATGSVHVCFRSTPEAIEAWRLKLEAKGLDLFEVDWEKGRSLYVYYPAGNLLEFAPPIIWDLP